jgi:hypothetical protein
MCALTGLLQANPHSLGLRELSERTGEDCGDVLEKTRVQQQAQRQAGK